MEPNGDSHDSEERGPSVDPAAQRRDAVVRALRRYHAKLARKRDALQSDLTEAERAEEFRRFGEALLTYAKQVPARAASVTLADPAAPERTLTIELDPAIGAPANAARYFKRASKATRGMREIPPRLDAIAVEVRELEKLLARAEAANPVDTGADAAAGDALDRELEERLARIPASVRVQIKAPLVRRSPGDTGDPLRPVAREKRGGRELPARFQPRRLKTREGWDVLIGRNNEGNDYLTHQLARPEDYWFHVGGGVAGSHVVLRRGKGANEPSKATIEEVAAWAAFYSQARTAGKVPVIVTLKKYVRKPRGSKPGLAMTEREKSVMVRPVEPPRTAEARLEN